MQNDKRNAAQSVVRNLTFDSNASKQNVEAAAKKIVTAVEKGSTRIVDALNKTKATQNSQASTPTIATGLANIAESMGKTADYLRSHPDKLEVAADATKGISQQLTDLADCAATSAQNDERLHEVVSETKKTSEWLGGNFSGGGVPVNNSFGRVVNSFESLWLR